MYEKYQCQKCGSNIGYLGRGVDFILFGPLHKCKDGDNRGFRNLLIIAAFAFVVGMCR